MKNTESSVVCASVGENTTKPEFDQAQLRQTTTTSYPTKKVGSTVFAEEDFGLPTNDFVGTKVAWINIPKGSTIEQVAENLAKYPKARLQKQLSFEPILTDDDKWAISNIANVTEETFAARQLVKNKDGVIMLVNGKKQYRKIVFSATGEPDLDLRHADASIAHVQVAEPAMVETTEEVVA